MIFAQIKAETAKDPSYSINLACPLLGVTAAGYHAWVKRPASARAVEDERLRPLIQYFFDESGQSYGARRIYHDLREHGERVARCQVERIMRQMGLKGHQKRLRRRLWQLQDDGLHAMDRVNRDWHPTTKNELWVADITQFRTWEGPLYLAAIMDVYSRRIVGWSMAEHMRTELIIDAFEMAIHTRKPAPGLVHHSDHGSQYTSYTFGKTLKNAGVEPSMGRVKTCYDCEDNG